jgi:hypothetical protein
MRAVAALALCGGCAWAFQSRLPDPHSPNSEPVCSTTAGWAVLDIIFAVGAGIAFDQALSKSGTDDLSPEALGAAIDLVIHVSSAGTGLQWAGECERAKSEWRSLGMPAATHTASKAASVEALDSEAERRHEEAAAVAAQHRATSERGFYCASSAATASASLCTKDRAACESARSAAVGFVPDLSPCALVEVAWCVGDQCAASTEACEARRMALGSDAPACSEQR